MNTVTECTVPEKILLAAFQLEEQGQTPFSAEALIVTAWRKYPRTFGLKGYDEQHPDSNKVLASIMGQKGLTRRGWFSKPAQKLYTLTHDGRRVVRRLLHGDEPLPVVSKKRAGKLSEEYENLLQYLFAAVAYDKLREGRPQEINFAEACRFWNVSDRLSGEALDAQLDGQRTALADIERQIGLENAILSDGRSVSLDEVGQLSGLHDHLRQRFGRHLTLLRNRAARP